MKLATRHNLNDWVKKTSGINLLQIVIGYSEPLLALYYNRESVKSKSDE